MKKFLFSLLAIACSQAALAETVFSCKVKSGKVAKLEKVGSSYQYSFGKANKPEIVVKNSAKQVLSNRLTGNVMYAYSEDVSAAIVNGQHTYLLHSYFSGRNGGSANVVVLKNGKRLAKLSCVYWNDDFDSAIRHREADSEAILRLVHE